MLELKNISFSYPDKPNFLKVDSLRLEKGQMVALIGLNGSGKSTLIRAISALDKLPNGEINVEGASIGSFDQKELSRSLSVVLTDAPFPYQMPVEEFVAFGRYPFTNWLAKQEAEDLQAIDQAIEKCGLTALKYKSMGDLSDGERQRALIARTLAQATQLIILDEPTTHLDGVNTGKVLKLLKEESKASNKSILFSTHKLLDSIQLADKLWILDSGMVREMSLSEFGKAKDLQKSLAGDHFDYDHEGGKFIFKTTSE